MKLFCVVNLMRKQLQHKKCIFFSAGKKWLNFFSMTCKIDFQLLHLWRLICFLLFVFSHFHKLLGFTLTDINQTKISIRPLKGFLRVYQSILLSLSLIVGYEVKKAWTFLLYASLWEFKFIQFCTLVFSNTFHREVIPCKPLCTFM